MANFLDALKKENNVAFTENGALTKRTSQSYVLDFFAQGGALRERSEEEIKNMFAMAFSENKLLALKALFYLRDCRGGQGERRTFRICLDWLATNYPDIAIKNFYNIPYYGRWDDTFWNNTVYTVFKEKLRKTILLLFNEANAKSFDVLSLAKWLPSENASDKERKQLAYSMMQLTNFSPRKYRKRLSSLRKQLNVVETFMCAKKWQAIDYSKVPSIASKNYRKAFYRHDLNRYEKFLDDVKSGKEKINTKVLTPYEIVRLYLNTTNENDEALNVLWDNLPNYVEDESKALVVADVSGSMTSNNLLPLSVSVSLALYFAERNTHPQFKNHFITFSGKPTLVEIKGDNLFEKINSARFADWGMNTDLNAVFKLILNTAKKYGIPQNDMPTKLFIVSDMQFDVAVPNNNKTNFEAIKELYEEAGYKMPTLVFWNVNATTSQSVVEKDEKDVYLVSGASPTIFKKALRAEAINPYDFMLETLNQERYDKVIV